MKSSSGKLFLFPLVSLVLASLVLAPPAEAARGGGGGGGARAGAAARPSVQPNHSRADVGTRDVRSTSVNNVNVNRNVNVSVDQNHRNWDHPVAAAVVVGAVIGASAAAVGSTVNVLPAECVPVYYGGMDYQQCGTLWYQYQGGSTFVVVNPPY
ncbi:MAG: hypothetical protein IT510_16690 [Sulfuritalea sp.]|jgi:hypothetical protein|nr:hypothetical protein [Sulfuritalea sp.]MCC7312875.1 hypothetical protein [Sulfuritalea sp.]